MENDGKKSFDHVDERQADRDLQHQLKEYKNDNDTE